MELKKTKPFIINRKLSNFYYVLFIFYFVSCKTNQTNAGTKHEINYIPYYLELYKADSLRMIGENEEAFKKLDSLFTIYEPLNYSVTKELVYYVKYAASTKKNINYKSHLTNLIAERGYPYKWIIQDSDLMNAYIINGFSKNDIKQLDSIFNAQINWEYRKELKEMFTQDQLSRGKLIEPSVDEYNAKRLIQLITQYGYPDIKTVGRLEEDRIMLGIMYFHLSRIDNYAELKNLLIEKLKEGKANPFDIENMITSKYLLYYHQDYFGKIDRETNGLKTIKFDVPLDTFNIRRKKYGLPSLQFARMKYDFYKNNTNP